MREIREKIKAAGADPLEFAAWNLLQALSEELGLDLNDENFDDTPARISRMYREILSGLEDTDGQVEKSF